MMFAKMHERKDSLGVLRRVLAVCDAELLGTVISDKKTGAYLDLKVYRSFYEGKKLSENEVVRLCHAADFHPFNAVGEKSISALSIALVVDKDRVKKIGRIPHLQIYKL